MINGYVFFQYAEPRHRKDVDLWIGMDSANVPAVFTALEFIGALLVDMTGADLAKVG